MMLIYPWLTPSNVSKDAKYSVRNGRNGWEVQLLFVLNSRERTLLATDGHEELIEMVNAIKEAKSGSAGGAFYINEFGDVLVPTTTDGCFFAGVYEGLLEFEFDGEIVSAEAPAGLSPGDEWPGPHMGVRYTLSAGGQDIKCEVQDGRISREHRLSDTAGEGGASLLAKRLASVKGSNGGRIYINERGNFFSPPRDGGTEHIFLGGIDEDQWFPAPDVPGRP
jgi:hypothetical protein